MQVLWDDELGAAGSFTVENGVHVIRLASAAPFSTMFHEALHSFYQTFASNEKTSQLNRTLHNAADTPYVMSVLKEMLKGDPDALAQLSDPEERVAYMHEAYSMGLLPELGKPAKTTLGKIMAAIRKVFGYISNDQRAKNIMDAINSGQFAGDDSPGAVARSLMEKGAGRKWVQQVGKVMEPVLKAAKEVTYSIGGKMQESVPAVRALGAAFNPEVGDEETRGTGFLMAVNRTASQWLNGYASALEGVDEYDKPEVLKALQMGDISGLRGKPLEAATKIRAALRKVVTSNSKYVKDKGETYFPRAWDSEAISEDVSGFASLLMKHGFDQSAAHQTANVIALNGGIHEPGESPFWAGEQQRVLPDTPAFRKDSEKYLAKDLDRVMITYMMHAAKRIEYVKRFGERGQKIDALLAQAKRQGATAQELAVVKQDVRRLLGTADYGDTSTINHLSQWAMTAANVLFMPLALFGSLGDPIGLATRTGDMRKAWEGYRNAVKEVPKSVRDGVPNTEAQQLAEDFGVNTNQALAMMQHAMYDSYGMQGLPRQINDALFRYNFMDGLTRSVRTTATQHALTFIEDSMNKPTKHSERWLNELGLTPEKRKALSMEGGKLKRDPDNAVLTAAVHRYVDSVMGRPNKAQMPAWADNPRFKVLAQYKSYAYNFQRTIMDRMTNEALEHQNYRPLVAAAAYLPVVITAMYARSFLVNGFSLGPNLAGSGPFDAVNMAVERQFGGATGVWSGALSDPLYTAGPTVNGVAGALSGS